MNKPCEPPNDVGFEHAAFDQGAFEVERLEPVVAPGYCDWVASRSTLVSLAWGIGTVGIGGYVDFFACW